MSDINSQAPMTGKSALVTGSSSGIGRATALLSRRLGCVVFATVRKKKDRDELAGLGDRISSPYLPRLDPSR